MTWLITLDYDDPQVMSPNRPEEDAPMVNPLNGPQNEQRGPEVLCQQNTLIQQVVHSNLTQTCDILWILI